MIGVAGLIVDGEWLAVGVKLAECDGVLDNDDAAANREEALSERSRSSRTYASRSTDSAALPRPDGGLMFGDGGEGDREMYVYRDSVSPSSFRLSRLLLQ